MPKIYSVLGKRLSETLMNSKFAKLSRAPYGTYAARKVVSTLREIELTDLPTQNPARRSSAGGKPVTVWQLWLQGWDKAPPLVSKLSALNEKANPSLEFHRLNLDEACEMVGLNSRVRQLYDDGKIKPSGLADLLRLRIVEQRGGVWLDATVATSPSLTRMLSTKPNFYLISGRQWGQASARHHTVTNWAFGAGPGDTFVRNWAHLQEQHSLRHGQLHHFDAFFCATALIKKGILPISDLSRLESLQLFDGGSKLINTWLKDRDFTAFLATYFSQPLHKLTYKMGPNESEQLERFLDGIMGQLESQTVE